MCVHQGGLFITAVQFRSEEVELRVRIICSRSRYDLTILGYFFIRAGWLVLGVYT